MEEKPREFKWTLGPHSQRTRTAWGGSSQRLRPLRSLGRRSPGWCSRRGSTWTWHTRWVYKKMETMSECKRYITRDAWPGEKPLAEARMVKDYTPGCYPGLTLLTKYFKYLQKKNLITIITHIRNDCTSVLAHFSCSEKLKIKVLSFTCGLLNSEGLRFVVLILTPLVARVTFPRVKSLERLLSLLNFSREALTRLLTGSLSKAAYDGQSGHCCISLAAGTVNRGESALGTGENIKNYKGELKRHCVQLVYFFFFFFYLVWSHRRICKAALLFELCWWRWQLCTLHIPTETNMKIRRDIPNHFIYTKENWWRNACEWYWVFSIYAGVHAMYICL